MALLGFDWDTDSGFLDWLLGLGASLYNLFNSNCDNQAECLTEAMNHYVLESAEYRDEMVNFVNELIARPMNISDGYSTDGLDVYYDVSLESLQSSTSYNTMTSIWKTVVTSSAPVDPCASKLSAKAYNSEGGAGNESLTNNDLELEIPFNILAQLAYYAGKQGLFCQESPFVVGSNFYPIAVVPNGAVTVAKGGNNDPDNLIKFTLPIKATGSGVGVNGSITGTLTIKGTIGLDDGADVVFVTTSATVSDLAGTITIGLISYPASALKSTINAAAGIIVSEMDDIELLNQVAYISDIGVRLLVGDVTTDEKALVIGLNFD
jgi:hypothetical protein